VSGHSRIGPRRPVSLVAVAVLATAFTLTTSLPSLAETSTKLYVVQVSGEPLATYVGTRPLAGQKLNPLTPAAVAYQEQLAETQSTVLLQAGIDPSRKVYDFAIVFNGFVAELTDQEAQLLRHTPGVVNVWKNTLFTGQTVSTPVFVGLDGPSGAWKKQFGDPNRAGEGVIVGVLDSGFWPENPSFAALPAPRPDQAAIAAKWRGTCDTGVEAPVACNNKVIGARWYDAGGLAAANPGEFSSPRDFDGHGSHTASTAAGNHGVAATVNGVPAGALSGMAPAARLAIYKVLYANAANTQTTGSTADIVAAVNQAVADGVDVINFSIGDDVDSFGPVELAFLNAAAAGVFVASSAGNAGPGASTVDNALPWQTTVAAGTHDRGSGKTVTLGDGRTFAGVGVGPARFAAPLVDATSAGAPGANPTQVAQCFSGGALAASAVAGKVVLCARGGNARVDKSLAVQQAGGVGMILYNVAPNTLNADYHFVPSIHVDEVAGAALKAYVATSAPTAALSAGQRVTVPAPDAAAFSSRGPSTASGGDLLKPDILAPGVDVLAAVAPPGNAGNLWDTNSGTSMSSPHIAGIAALLIAKHPGWSPMAVKSALMTTAVTPATGSPLDYGAGEVAALRAFNPGLVYDSGPMQWLRYLCGTGVHLMLTSGTDVCAVVGSADPSDLNGPSIAVGDLAGTQVVRRTVTNVDNRSAVYEARVTAPPGFTATVSPSRLRLASGASASYLVTLTRTPGPGQAAAFGTWAFGSLTWADQRNHQVRSPIAVRPVRLAAPAERTATGTAGSTTLVVKSGYAGAVTAAVNGLVPAVVTNLSLATDPSGFDPANPAPSARTGMVPVTVPAGTGGTAVGRFATYAADHPTGTDLDLYVYATDPDGGLTLVGQSGGGTAEEVVTLTEPGDYVVFVDLFAVPGGLGRVTARHHHWIVATGGAGNATVAPVSQPVIAGGSAPVSITWTGLTAGGRYLGVVDFADGTDGTERVGRTILAVRA
jgi:hypothetical protein